MDPTTGRDRRYRQGHGRSSMAALLPLPILLAVLLTVPGCSKKSNPTGPQIVANLTSEGWVFFEEGDYTSALAKFDEALGILSEYWEAHLGRGWTLAFMGEFEESRFALVTASELRNSVVDTWAGGALVYSVLGDAYRTIQWAEQALLLSQLGGRAWVFGHRPAITHVHVRLVLAFAYWEVGAYVQCKEELDIIEPGTVHTKGPADLLADLQRLQDTLRVF